MKNLESPYKKLPVKMNAFLINEYVNVKYTKIKEGLNCFLSLRKLTYGHIESIVRTNTRRQMKFQERFISYNKLKERLMRRCRRNKQNSNKI